MKQILMESNNEEDLQLLLHLADRLNIRHSAHLPTSDLSDAQYEQIRHTILTYSGQQTSSVGDASEWQSQIREDRLLPWQTQ